MGSTGAAACYTPVSSRFVFRESRFGLLRFREICDSATKEEEQEQQEREVGSGNVQLTALDFSSF